jgi:hypothetical protein
VQVTANSGEASTTLAEVELLGHPAPACTSTIGDTVTGAVTVRTGVTCITAGATVTGLVTVRSGASLYVTGGTLRGAVTAAGAGTVALLHASVTGPVTAAGSGPVSIEDSTVRGPVTLLGGKVDTLVSGNRIDGGLTCTGNRPPPHDNGLANAVAGPRLGQCAKL